MPELSHIPVLLEQSVNYLLNGRSSGIFIDATLGGGGHSEKILSQLDNRGKLIGIDQDSTAISLANDKLESYPNFTAFKANYRKLDEILKELSIDGIDGIIMDLGLSSMQLDQGSRGFSFKLDARLDMRMDNNETDETAYGILNNLKEESLKKIFKQYGEERWAGRIASRIVEYRKEKPIETTAELAKLIEKWIPRRFQSRRIHPATRIFQALRIAVNDELEALKDGLEEGIKFLKPGGRFVVISYHSLEDRIVKHTFRRYDREEKVLKVITKKPETPTQEEIEANPKSRSAKMRVAEKRATETQI